MLENKEDGDGKAGEDDMFAHVPWVGVTAIGDMPGEEESTIVVAVAILAECGVHRDRYERVRLHCINLGVLCCLCKAQETQAKHLKRKTFCARRD